MKYKVTGSVEELCKSYFFLAYKASNVFGMGLFQARDGATKEQVWRNVSTMGDYPTLLRVKRDEPYGDYVFGRMLKLGIRIEGDCVLVPAMKPRLDYQSWCCKYKTYEDLILEAAIDAGVEIEEVV